MRLVIQRVLNGSVSVEGKTVGSIAKGYVVLVGISDADRESTVEKMTRKMLHLRIFEDSAGKTNLALKDVRGELLLISQFTLYADCRHGNRPGFTGAGSPAHAEKLYQYMISLCGQECKTEHGIFGADMQVSLVNDGPFTILLDSDELQGMHP